MKKISSFQKNFINNCFDYLKDCKRKNINISTSPLCFFTIWAQSPGKLIVNKFLEKSYFYDLIYILKNIASISYNHDLEVQPRKKEYNSKKNKIFISYSSKNNFDRHGNFFDYYFNVGNKKKRDCIFFLISLDGYIPKNLKEDIFVLKKKDKGSLSLIYFLKKLYKLIIKNKFSLNKIKHYCWYEYDFANEVKRIFHESFEIKKIKKLLINYENIPWQNLIINQIKNNDKVQTLGYLHCAPWPVQSDLIFKNVSLDKLYVSSQDQKNILYNYLGWNKKKISVIPSLRFMQSSSSNLNGYIFPPYNLNKKNNFLQKFEFFLNNLSNNSLNTMKVRIHPLNKESSIHLKFKNDINNLLKKYKSKFTAKNKKISIFFGSATGVCVQAMEEGTKIIHFPNDYLLDVFSNKIWSNINTQKIFKDIYEYKLKNFKRTFFTNKEKNKFSKYVNF